MGIITTIVNQELRGRLYEETAAVPYRGTSILHEAIWGDPEGTSILEILTDQLPPGVWGHCDAVIDGDRIRFKKHVPEFSEV